MQQLETLAYDSPRASEARQVVYVVGDLEELSASALYGYGTGGSVGGGGALSGFNGKAPSGGSPRPASIGTFSDFKPASEFGIGPGIVDDSEYDLKGLLTKSFLERYRAGKHEDYGEDHINLDILSPVTRKHLLDLHINFDDD